MKILALYFGYSYSVIVTKLPISELVTTYLGIVPDTWHRFQGPQAGSDTGDLS